MKLNESKEVAVKKLKLVFLVVLVLGLAFTLAYAAGNVENGKKLFENPKFAGATSGKSCSSCHPNGQGIEGAGTKDKFTIMGNDTNSLEDAVNVCIKHAINGKPIKKNSQDMMDIVAYIKSLKK